MKPNQLVIEAFGPYATRAEVDFDALADKTFGDPDFPLFAAASSGLAVSYGASGACTVAGSIVRSMHAACGRSR